MPYTGLTRSWRAIQAREGPGAGDRCPTPGSDSVRRRSRPAGDDSADRMKENSAHTGGADPAHPGRRSLAQPGHGMPAQPGRGMPAQPGRGMTRPSRVWGMPGRTRLGPGSPFFPVFLYYLLIYCYFFSLIAPINHQPWVPGVTSPTLVLEAAGDSQSRAQTL